MACISSGSQLVNWAIKLNELERFSYGAAVYKIQVTLIARTRTTKQSNASVSLLEVDNYVSNLYDTQPKLVSNMSSFVINVSFHMLLRYSRIALLKEVENFLVYFQAQAISYEKHYLYVIIT